MLISDNQIHNEIFDVVASDSSYDNTAGDNCFLVIVNDNSFNKHINIT